MEHAQRASPEEILHVQLFERLNPYFNGTCSKSRAAFKNGDIDVMYWS